MCSQRGQTFCVGQAVPDAFTTGRHAQTIVSAALQPQIRPSVSVRLCPDMIASGRQAQPDFQAKITKRSMHGHEFSAV